MWMNIIVYIIEISIGGLVIILTAVWSLGNEIENKKLKKQLSEQLEMLIT